jgi:hypothetical protein
LTCFCLGLVFNCASCKSSDISRCRTCNLSCNLTGTNGATSAVSCWSCAAGLFSSSASITQCLSCVARAYSTSFGATDSSLCLNCRAGTYSSIISAIASVSCVPCSAGQLSTTSGASSISFCQICSPGTYSSLQGSAMLAPLVRTIKMLGLLQSITVPSVNPDSTHPSQVAQTRWIVLDVLLEHILACLALLPLALVRPVMQEHTPIRLPIRWPFAHVVALVGTAGTYSSSIAAPSIASCFSCVAGRYSTSLRATTSSACLSCSQGTHSTTIGGTSAKCLHQLCCWILFKFKCCSIHSPMLELCCWSLFDYDGSYCFSSVSIV